MTPNLHVAPSPEAAADLCATFITGHLASVLESQGRATIAISGGSTPKLLFERLQKTPFDWSHVHFFWVDERCVPPNDGQSNFKLADDTLLTPARVSKYNVHRIQGELPPAEGAQRYVEELRDYFGVADGQLPVFDLIHRGMGPDAHTASLFPGEPLIADRTGIAAAVWVEKLKSNRVTLLPGVLLAARQTVILAAGEDKAEPLQQVLEGPVDFSRFPCQIATREAAHCDWFLDQPAVMKLRDAHK